MATATLAAIAEHPLYSINPEPLETAAAGLATMATSIRNNGSEVVSAWTPISTHYSGPGDAELFAAMTPVGTTSTTVGDNLDSVASALRTFKTTADEVKASMDQLKLDHAALKTKIDDFEPTIEDGPMSYDAKSTMNWYEDEALQAENTRIIQELSNCLEKMHEAERTCANAIRALHGLSPLTAGDGGYDKGEYGVDEIDDEAETPWGTAAFDDESCGESAWNTTVGMGKDLVGLVGMQWDEDGDFSWTLDNALSTYEGFGALIGRDPETNEFSWDTFGDTWINMGKDFTAWDRWGENPNAAFGQVVVNGVSSIGIVGIIGKISKGGRVASAGSHGPDGDGPDGNGKGNGADGNGFDYNDVNPDGIDLDELMPDMDGIDFDVEIDKILDSDTDTDTSGPHTDTDVPPVRDADSSPSDTTPDRNDADTGTTTPGDGTPNGDDGSTPSDQTPNGETPDDTAPDDTTPEDSAPGDAVPGDDTPGDGSPADGTPNTDDPNAQPDPIDGSHPDGPSPEDQARIDRYEHLINAQNPDGTPRFDERVQRLFEGEIFNIENHYRYPVNELHVTKPGSDNYSRIDSFVPDAEVVSRKNTQLAEITPGTANHYLSELANKYGLKRDDIVVADTLTNRRDLTEAGYDPDDYIGQPLTGQHVLEVPVQNAPPPLEFLTKAQTAQVRVADVEGTSWAVSADGVSVVEKRADGTVINHAVSEGSE
jgi:hypothetical protein